MRLRFWLLGSLRIFGSVVGASAIYAIFMWIQMDDGKITNVLTLLPLYFLLFGAIMLLAMTMSLYKMMVSLSLSFGSTRREALAGLHVYRLLPTLGVAAVMAMLTVIPGTEPLFSPQTTILVTLGTFLLCSAVGSALGMIYYRFGKVGAVIMTVCIVLLAITGGILGILSTRQSAWLQAIFNHVPLSWMALGLGAAVYLIVMIPEYVVIRRYQVKL